MAQLFPNKINLQKGFGVIEVLVGISLTAILLTVFLTLSIQSIKVSRANIKELRATMYLQELIEITKDLEQTDEGWNKIISSACTTPSDYYPEVFGDEWILVSLNPGEFEELEDGDYKRSLKILNVSRSTTTFPNEIVTSTCIAYPYDDPNTKKVIATVFWDDGYQPRTSTLETYLYNYTP